MPKSSKGKQVKIPYSPAAVSLVVVRPIQRHWISSRFIREDELHRGESEDLPPFFSAALAPRGGTEVANHDLNLCVELEVVSPLRYAAVTLTFVAATASAQVHDDRHLSSAEVVGVHADASVASATPEQKIDTLSMRRMGVTSTADALRRFAGVNLRDYGGAGGLKTVSVRGLGAQHTAVVYDGVTVSNAQQGQIDLGRFPIDRLTSIELHTADEADLLVPVRQLAAATVVLHSWLPNVREQGLHGAVALRQGSFGVWNPSVLLIQNWNKRTAFSLSADYFHGNNAYPFIVENGVDTHREHRLNSQMNDWTLEANAQHLLHHGQLSGKIYYVTNHRYLPGPVTLYVQGNNEHLTEQNGFAQLRWTQHFRRWQFFSAAKADFRESRYLDIDGKYPGGRLFQRYRQNEIYGSAGASHEWHNLTAALATDWFHNGLTSNLNVDNDVWRTSWLTSLTLRYAPHHFELTGRLVGSIFRNGAANGAEAAKNASRLSPSLSASWKIVSQQRTHLFMRAHYKEFFRVPTFTESYYYHLGSTHLRPERTRQLGLGVTFAGALSHHCQLQLTADGYLNRVWDKISSIPYNLFVWRTVNLGKVRAAGLDVAFQGTWTLSPEQRLTANATYTYQRITDRSDKQSDEYGYQLAYTPTHSGAVSVAWENPWVNAVANATIVGRRWATNEHTLTTDVPAYADVGMGLYRTFHLHGFSLEARADVTNVFNHQYEVIRRYPMPGRAYRLSVTLRW